jgi:hypothetical protein
VDEDRRSHPVRVSGEVAVVRRSRLVTWLLLAPCPVLLVFLCTSFFGVTVVAFFAVLFTLRTSSGRRARAPRTARVDVATTRRRRRRTGAAHLATSLSP